jgi:K+-transporting ATPase KdpF subunit
MNLLYWIVSLIDLGLFVYLIIALLKPEKFE